MRLLSVCLSLLLIMSAATAEEIKEDNLHVRTWNQFSDNLLKLHQKRIKNPNVVVKESTGGYFHLPDFYLQKDYFLGNRLIASVRWEREKPENLHSIELYIHDKQGRVIRDYTVAYLPNYRNAATQTLISLHRYHEGLHAIRIFDASGYRITERCTGVFEGEEVDILLDEDEIAEALDDTHVNQGIMMTYEYENCFGNLQQQAGKYLIPQ